VGFGLWINGPQEIAPILAARILTQALVILHEFWLVILPMNGSAVVKVCYQIQCRQKMLVVCTNVYILL
jgi:hypothetical protein